MSEAFTGLMTLCGLLFIPLVVSGILFLQRDPIYRYSNGNWLDVKEHPIPEKIKGFIATDGNEVEHLYTPIWGPHGKVLFWKYKDNSYVTHWMPLPDVPKK